MGATEDIAALFMSMIDSDLLRELQLTPEKSSILFNRFITTLQTAFDNEKHLVNKHTNENFEDVHLLDVHIRCLKRSIW